MSATSFYDLGFRKLSNEEVPIVPLSELRDKGGFIPALVTNYESYIFNVRNLSGSLFDVVVDDVSSLLSALSGNSNTILVTKELSNISGNVTITKDKVIESICPLEIGGLSISGSSGLNVKIANSVKFSDDVTVDGVNLYITGLDLDGNSVVASNGGKVIYEKNRSEDEIPESPSIERSFWHSSNDELNGIVKATKETAGIATADPEEFDIDERGRVSFKDIFAYKVDPISDNEKKFVSNVSIEDQTIYAELKNGIDSNILTNVHSDIDFRKGLINRKAIVKNNSDYNKFLLISNTASGAGERSMIACSLLCAIDNKFYEIYIFHHDENRLFFSRITGEEETNSDVDNINFKMNSNTSKVGLSVSGNTSTEILILHVHIYQAGDKVKLEYNEEDSELSFSGMSTVTEGEETFAPSIYVPISSSAGKYGTFVHNSTNTSDKGKLEFKPLSIGNRSTNKPVTRRGTTLVTFDASVGNQATFIYYTKDGGFKVCGSVGSKDSLLFLKKDEDSDCSRLTKSDFTSDVLPQYVDNGEFKSLHKRHAVQSMAPVVVSEDSSDEVLEISKDYNDYTVIVAAEATSPVLISLNGNSGEDGDIKLKLLANNQSVDFVINIDGLDVQAYKGTIDGTSLKLSSGVYKIKKIGSTIILQ